MVVNSLAFLWFFLFVMVVYYLLGAKRWIRPPHPDGHPLLTQERKRILYLLIMIFTTASMSASVIPSLPSSSAFESLKPLD